MAKAGKKRDAHEINIWLRRNFHSVQKIADDLGNNHSLVSNTIAGRENNRRVLQWLVDKGCPVRYLDLPKDMRRAA